jgi:hypothetical protein
VIGTATFGQATGGVRALRFVPRASIPLEAACVVANGIRETLRELLGECDLVLGEPAALGPQAWALLARDSLLFLTRGRLTDVVIVLPQRDARRLVLRAFGEGDELPDGACSALELHALERIAARCAGAFEPLFRGRGEAPRAVRGSEVPACAAYFDVRVRAPLALTLGIGVVRELPDPDPTAMLARSTLDALTVDLRAVFAEGILDAAGFVELRPGSVVKLETKVGAPASLNLGAGRLATGAAGVVGSHTAFLVHDVATGVHQ